MHILRTEVVPHKAKAAHKSKRPTMAHEGRAQRAVMPDPAAKKVDSIFRPASTVKISGHQTDRLRMLSRAAGVSVESVVAVMLDCALEGCDEDTLNLIATVDDARRYERKTRRQVGKA